MRSNEDTSPQGHKRKRKKVRKVLIFLTAAGIGAFYTSPMILHAFEPEQPATDNKGQVYSDRLFHNAHTTDRLPRISSTEFSAESTKEDKPAHWYDKESMITINQITSSPALSIDTFFDDAIFIGDSRTEMLGYFVDMGASSFYTYEGLMINTALHEPKIKLKDGTLGTVIDAASERSFDRAYILFGINELGWPNYDVFILYYQELIAKLRVINPDVSIYVQANYPVSKRRSMRDELYNNPNLITMNQKIKAMAEKEGVHYIDLYELLGNAEHTLPEDASNDGIHMKTEYLKQWKQVLFEYGYGD